MLTVLSLGAGVQSTTLALMAAHGEIELPKLAIFADTGWEPAGVYEHLRWLMSPNVLPFPVEIVSAGDIRSDTLAVIAGGSLPGRGRAATAPFFTAGKDGVSAPLRRQCTGHYKVEPIEKRLRELVGIVPRQRLPKAARVRLLIGISTDEAHRMKQAPQPWVERAWPLINARMTRNDCLRWLDRKGYPRPSKSSCIGCPYHNNQHWREMRAGQPDEFADAVRFDEEIRGGFASTRGEVFLHRSLQPLSIVNLASAADKAGQIDMFGNECEGMCGV